MAECTQNPEFLLLPFPLMPTRNLLLGDGRVSGGVPGWWDAVAGSPTGEMQWWGSWMVRCSAGVPNWWDVDVLMTDSSLVPVRETCSSEDWWPGYSELTF